MKIGDEVYVHGFVDEIRKDTVIIRNDGGYFGTDKGEIVSGKLRTKQDVEDAIKEVLEIIDSMIDSDEFHNHNENAVCRKIKNRVLALKGGEHENSN